MADIIITWAIHQLKIVPSETYNLHKKVKNWTVKDEAKVKYHMN